MLTKSGKCDKIFSDEKGGRVALRPVKLQTVRQSNIEIMILRHESLFGIFVAIFILTVEVAQYVRTKKGRKTENILSVYRFQQFIYAEALA